MTTKRWRSLLRMLRERFPTESHIEVRRCPMKDDGVTTLERNTFRIRINSNLTATSQIDSLIHEWGHALAIEEGYKHDQVWGIAHAAVYRAWEEWDDEIERAMKEKKNAS